MLGNIGPLLHLDSNRCIQNVTKRYFYFKFKRTKVPPLQTPRESPYIVGPYLKPEYVEREYISEPLEHRKVDDFEHAIYEFEKIEPDPDRKVKLLLIQDVEGLGVAGQIVDAQAIHGASKLIAMRKAEYCTDFAQKWYKFGPMTEKSASSALSPRTARLLQTKVYQLPITNKTKVQPWHISLALRLSGCICPVDAIVEDSIQTYIDEEGVEHVKCTIIINNHERVETRFVFNENKRPQ